MEFTYEVEPDGWALITHADGRQYRIRYDNMGEPLSAGEIHLMTTDGHTPGIHPPTVQRIGLTRITVISHDLDADDIRDTATKFLHGNDFPCIGEDYACAVVILSEVKENGDWVIVSLGGKETMTIATAQQPHNS